MKFLFLTALLSFAAYAQPLKETESKLKHATASFNACKNGRLRLRFAETLASLETARKQLEVARRQTVAERLKLEATRKEIESEKGQSPEHYLARLTTEYTTPMNERVRAAEGVYVAGIAEYAAGIEKFGTFCSEKNTPESEAAFFSESYKQTQQLVERTSTLVKQTAVSQAR